MDIKYQKEFFSIANDVRQNLNAAILLTIHDINLAVNYCDRLIILNHRNIIYDGNTQSVAQILFLRLLIQLFQVNAILKSIFIIKMMLKK